MPLASYRSAPAPSFAPAQWRDALQSTASEVAKVALGYPGATVADMPSLDDIVTSVGAHIPLVGKPSYELWFGAPRENCRSLASAVLGGMDLTGMPPSATSDAICELVNMLAGGVKRRLQGADLELGLPVYVNGSIEPSDRLMQLGFRVKLGAVTAYTVIVGSLQ